MTEARTVLPTDIFALVSFDGRVYANEARTWERIGLPDRGPHPLEAALEQWFSFATGKHAWVSVKGATIQGLISARPRAKRSVWEVECLISATDDPGICQSLLARMSQDVTRYGAQRIFLRLPAHSRFCASAARSGFFPYVQETLYSLDKPSPASPSPDLEVRPKVQGDMYRLYQLYSCVTPANVRSIEGVTFRDWLAAQEPWGGRRSDWLLERQGEAKAWLRYLADGNRARLRLLLASSDQALAEDMVAFALARLPEGMPVFSLVPSHLSSASRALQSHGFQPREEYVTLAKRVAAVEQETVPEKAGRTILVS